MRRIWGTTLVVGTLLCSLVTAGAQEPELVSTWRGQPNGFSVSPAISNDGRWVSFGTYDNLVARDHNNQYDVYVRQLGSDMVERVSVASDGSEANNPSSISYLSPDGRFVAFDSYASNLVPGDNNNLSDLFLRDRVNGTTELISVATDGTLSDQPMNGSAAISADGRYVVFDAYATTLAPNYPGQSMHLYLRDRVQRTTTRIVPYGRTPAMSADGRFVAYNRAKFELLDRQTGLVVTVGQPAFFPSKASLSADGRFVVYEGLPVGGGPMSVAVFVYDRMTRSNRQITPTIERTPWVSTTSFESWLFLKPKITADGRFVFYFLAGELARDGSGDRLMLYDLAKESTQPLFIDNLWVDWRAPNLDVSGDGSTLVFCDLFKNHLPRLAGYNKNTGTGVFTWQTGVESGSGAPAGDVKLTAEPTTLSPANSKLVPVKLSMTAPGASKVEIRIADEYGTFSQTLYGSTATVPLEAWRQGNDPDGRTYTVTAIATDTAGRQSSATATITVPHDQR